MVRYKVGLTELKSHLSLYLKKTQQGHTIIITSYGKPVAQLASTKKALMKRVKILQEAGLIAWNGKNSNLQNQ